MVSSPSGWSFVLDLQNSLCQRTKEAALGTHMHLSNILS